MDPIKLTNDNIIEIENKVQEILSMQTDNATWKLGSALETHMQLLKTLGTDGVEAELKRIREATFERMRNHKPVYISWEQIYRGIEQRKRDQAQS